ncbi:MAG: MFS transporter [Solirubrobacterales bacterium]
MRQAIAPLRLPGFRPLALGYTVNELGNWLGDVALAILVFNHTGSPLATAGLFLAMQFLPALTSQFVVVRGEMAGAKRALPTIYAAEAAVLLLLALLAENFSLAGIIVLAALDGTLAIAARVLLRATSATVLEPVGLLREGNAIINVAFTTASMIGPVVAGLVVTVYGTTTALLLDAGSFLAVSLILLIARSVPDLRNRQANWRKELRAGIRYVWERSTLRRLIWANAAIVLFLTAAVPIEIVLVKESLGSGDAGYGVLLAAWGTGMILGGLLFVAARQVSLQVLLIASATLVGCSYIGMGMAPSLSIALVASMAGGVGNGVLWVATVSAIQAITAREFQARVMGVLELTASASPGLGFPLGGLLAYLFSPRTSFVVSGIGALIVVLVASFILRNSVWADSEPSDDVSDVESLVALEPISLPNRP